MRYLLLVQLLAFLSGLLSAQTETEIDVVFQAFFEEELINPTDLSEEPSPEGVRIEVLKFYVSKLELYDQEELVFAEPQSYHLINLEEPKSLKLSISLPEDLAYSKLKFSLGIDSLTNVSGAFGGDLDPTKGMYWTWQSGYINFKLEGTSPKCPARQNAFVYHIGGYQSPYQTIRDLEFDVIPGRNIIVDLSMDRFFDMVDMGETYHLMSPGKKAAELSNNIPSLFSVSNED